MTDRLLRLREEYDQANQETKRAIGKYIHDRPGRWIPKQLLVTEFDLDESVVGRHLDDFHEDSFVQSRHDEQGRRMVRWDGPGAGGLEYRLRQLLPERVWRAGQEVRPLFTLDVLGGAYPITLFAGLLWVSGIVTGLFFLFVLYSPWDSILGVTVTDALVLTGTVTVFASLLFVFIPLAYILDRVLTRGLNWVTGHVRDDQRDKK